MLLDPSSNDFNFMSGYGKLYANAAQTKAAEMTGQIKSLQHQLEYEKVHLTWSFESS
jgi:hypothetical protein